MMFRGIEFARNRIGATYRVKEKNLLFVGKVLFLVGWLCGLSKVRRTRNPDRLTSSSSLSACLLCVPPTGGTVRKIIINNVSFTMGGGGGRRGTVP